MAQQQHVMAAVHSDPQIHQRYAYFRPTAQIVGAQLEILEPAGHCFWLEQPERSGTMIRRFLESH